MNWAQFAEGTLGRGLPHLDICLWLWATHPGGFIVWSSAELASYLATPASPQPRGILERMASGCLHGWASLLPGGGMCCCLMSFCSLVTPGSSLQGTSRPTRSLSTAQLVQPSGGLQASVISNIVLMKGQAKVRKPPLTTASPGNDMIVLGRGQSTKVYGWRQDEQASSCNLGPGEF